MVLNLKRDKEKGNNIKREGVCNVKKITTVSKCGMGGEAWPISRKEFDIS